MTMSHVTLIHVTYQWVVSSWCRLQWPIDTTSCPGVTSHINDNESFNIVIRIYTDNTSTSHVTFVQWPTTHCNTLQHTATHYNTLQHTPPYDSCQIWHIPQLNRILTNHTEARLFWKEKKSFHIYSPLWMFRTHTLHANSRGSPKRRSFIHLFPNVCVFLTCFIRTYINIYICIYICTSREREREREIRVCVCMHAQTYTHQDTSLFKCISLFWHMWGNKEIVSYIYGEREIYIRICIHTHTHTPGRVSL